MFSLSARSLRIRAAMMLVSVISLLAAPPARAGYDLRFDQRVASIAMSASGNQR